LQRPGVAASPAHSPTALPLSLGPKKASKTRPTAAMRSAPTARKLFHPFACQLSTMLAGQPDYARCSAPLRPFGWLLLRAALHRRRRDGERQDFDGLRRVKQEIRRLRAKPDKKICRLNPVGPSSTTMICPLRSTSITLASALLRGSPPLSGASVLSVAKSIFLDGGNMRSANGLSGTSLRRCFGAPRSAIAQGRSHGRRPRREPFALRSPAIEAGHVGGGGGLIDEDKLLRIKG
jgi:hypothetical protein